MTSTTSNSSGNGVRATAFMIGLLASLSAIGQFATNIYLPALPAISADMMASPSQAQLTLTAFLAAFALTQLVYGPLSDRFGRRIILIVGLTIFIGGSALCALSTDINSLILGRILQAIGGGGCTVAARAVIRDSFDGPALQKVMALVAVLFALVPALSPMFGALLLDFHGWRVIFTVTGGAGAIVAVLMVTRLPETLAHRLERLDFAELVKGYREVLSNREFNRYAFPMALTFSAMFAFFGGSPYTFIEHLGVTETEYGLYPPLASSGFVIGGLLVRRLAGRIGVQGICALGLCIVTTACLIGLFGFHFVAASKYTFVFAIVIFVTGMGVFLPMSMASALQLFPERAGTASAVLGFLQMGGAGLGSAFVAAFQEQAPFVAYPVIMLSATVTAGLIFLALRPAR
jgi:DHA1 family bicyclomycin/chloramphenicol resistance-like MFS transporter